MLANSLADVVAEEAAKRLLPDMTFEHKAQRSERTGVSRLALVQADIWVCWILLWYRPCLLLRNWLERSPTQVIYS